MHLVIRGEKGRKAPEWKQNKQISDGGRWVGDECGLSTGMNSCRYNQNTKL